jgi:predicted amidophosphoribosyltransferase
MNGKVTDEKALETALAASITHAIHEVFEFARMDGKPVMVPHPIDEEAMWRYLFDNSLEIVRGYKKKFPK